MSIQWLFVIKQNAFVANAEYVPIFEVRKALILLSGERKFFQQVCCHF